MFESGDYPRHWDHLFENFQASSRNFTNRLT